MLQSIRQLYGTKLGASDGHIGHIKDFYFDDRKWVVRYVVVDTGNWIPGRLVLISPHAFGSLYADGGILLVNLTRQQIESSPPIESHKPVSRQFEEDYYRHYGWPSYWHGGEVWGVGGFPVAPPFAPPSSQTMADGKGDGNEAPHLRSTQTLGGYQIQNVEGTIGQVVDFMMDDKSWVIREIVVETGHWLSKKKIVMPANHIGRISYDESKLFVDVTNDAIQQGAEYQIPPLGAGYHDTRGFDD
ncbi:MAG: PRC-barrel domain-containing protein [Chthoniobacteraceae bacterium]